MSSQRRNVHFSLLFRLMSRAWPGLKDSEIAEIDQGKAVAKILESPTPSEVFVFGSVFIKAQPSSYMKMAVDLDRLKSLPNYLRSGASQIRRSLPISPALNSMRMT